jgi:hypothetical protein
MAARVSRRKGARAMSRPNPCALVLVSALACGCGAALEAPSPANLQAQRVVTERVMALSQEIDELGRRYDSLLKQNAAIEQLLARLGFTVQMTTDTVQERVDMMRRFERAEAARTACFGKLRSLLKTLAAQQHVDTGIELRAGQIVVRLSEKLLYDAKGRFRVEAAPLVWAVADGLKEFTGRQFEVVTEVRLPRPGPDTPAAQGAAETPARRASEKASQKAKKKARRGAEPESSPEEQGFAGAAHRGLDILKQLRGAGIPGERLSVSQRLVEGEISRPPFVEIIVLPTGDELPRVHGAVDSAAAAAPARVPAPAPGTR